MARKLTPTEFYKEVSNNCNVNEEIVKKVYLGLVDVLINELVMYGNSSLPYITETMYLQKQSEFTKLPTGEIVKVEKNINRLYVRYSETFKEQINGLKLSKAEKNKNKALSRKIELEEKEVQRQKEKDLKHQENFDKMVEAKRQKAIQRKIDRKKTNKKIQEELRQKKIESGEILSYGEE